MGKGKYVNIIPTNPYNDKYSSLIRPIKIFLPPRKENGEQSKYDDFVGRERLMERLFLWLSDKNQESGSYLVTGFRGMGKTSLVDRTIGRLVRETNPKVELWAKMALGLFIVSFGCLFVGLSFFNNSSILRWIGGVGLVISVSWLLLTCLCYNPKNEIKRLRKQIPNRKLFQQLLVDRIARGSRLDVSHKEFSNIKVSVNLGHEVLKERDILGLIATNVRDKYKEYINSIQPRWGIVLASIFLLCGLSIGVTCATKYVIAENVVKKRTEYKTYADVTKDKNTCTVLIEDNWFSRTAYNTALFVRKTYGKIPHIYLLLFYLLSFLIVKKICNILVRVLPRWGTPANAIRRLNLLVDRIVATTDEETGSTSTLDKSLISISLFNRRKHKTMPIADIREIETELASIINNLAVNCSKYYRAKFLIVFDEMDKIDPAMVDTSKSADIPEFTDTINGFPEGMDSRERRRNVLKLLANIKLFVSTAKSKFVFISGRELYDAYLADLSDREFAISSIFSGVLNVDSFLTPEGGQTDVSSMSEWYITNRLMPKEWLHDVELRNANGQQKNQGYRNDKRATLKQEKPSLRWYYEYLIDKCNTSALDATYVIGFLHTFAAYLTHISNGSPKKIFLYFDKHIRRAEDCIPMNDWNDVLTIGEESGTVLYFDPVQQKAINFVYYLADPIMGTITNDLSNFGDRFLVSLSFIIDHIYKHHNRSFSWRNMEQIPDLLRTSKAPELRDSVMSIMEYLSQTHISPILIGLNEYKFHSSIAEEISMMSKMSDEASAIFNFTLDESLPVIQHNTRMLNHYLELDKADRERNNSHGQYIPIIARIHSNLGDLHFWDENYYSASLEYRAAIDAFSKDETVAGFLTRARCFLKLGLTYESRKLFPNAYQIYCQLMELLIKKRWINDTQFGLTTRDQFVDDWRGKRQVMVYKEPIYGVKYQTTDFENQFYHKIANINDGDSIAYGVNVDGVVSSFAGDLTIEKTSTINSLTLFEEIRYLYQAILAKLSVLEKMGMSGITQTNIDVAEGEFKAIHKSINIKEKFIISADFFRKLAEVLYYKNSLTILTQNQDSFYASVYYDDYDLLSNLDDYCKYDDSNLNRNTIAIRHDVRMFFNLLDNPASKDDKHPVFQYDSTRKACSYKELFREIQLHLGEYLDLINRNDLLKPGNDWNRIYDNVNGYLNYCIDKVHTNDSLKFYYGSVEACDHHCRKMRKEGLRPPCYACKYYTRSLRILAENMFGNSDLLDSKLTKAYGVLKHSFKHNLLYTRSNHIRILAQTLEGFGNVMLSCASGDNLERDDVHPGRGVSAEVINMLIDLCDKTNEDEELRIINGLESKITIGQLSRLDKSILYYWDAYRFYLMDSCYNEAVGCLSKIVNLMAYYIEVLCYYGGGEDLLWNKDKEAETVKAIIGNPNEDNGFVMALFRLISRYTGYKYDLTNLAEISELKRIYSKDMRDNIDLTRLSLYPAIRSVWLRIVEIKAKGLHFLEGISPAYYKHEEYMLFIKQVYPLIAPKDRNETTFYEEVLGYYTKMRFNDHILNEIFDGNPMLNNEVGGYSNSYHIQFYEKLANYLELTADNGHLDCLMFDTEGIVDKRLKLVEFLILDTLVCITKMVKVFVPHNNLSSYSNSFIGIIYNYYWEWSHKYEFLYSLYQYDELKRKKKTTEAENIIRNMASSSSYGTDNVDDVCSRLRGQMERCRMLMSSIEYSDDEEKYGTRSERFFEQLRHNVDDITISNIYSNYTAEMALKYYQRAEETNTEGTAYKEMMGTMYFLDDNMNNDTNQFNIACDRFLLNCGIVAKQRKRLDAFYRHSNVYNLRKAYIDGPNTLRDEVIDPHRFDRSQFINSEY